MQLRPYKPSDCPAMATLFYNTVHTVNSKDYTAAELDAWATGSVDLEEWNQSFLDHITLIAEIDGILVGFGDIDHSGYLDRLYVHKDYQRQGIATKLCNELEARISSGCFVTHASITARPFFENRGYRVVNVQQVERNGVCLTNYVMEKKRQ